ncbi:amidohydrolase family protein [Streptomyces sp. NPDC054840]
MPLDLGSEHDRLPDQGMPEEQGLDLAGFDPYAVRLELGVRPAQVLQDAVGAAPGQITGAVERAKAMVEVILDMREAGVRFIAGTDAGVPGAHFGDYVGMLEFFASLGFAHREILDMATVNAARALGLPDTGVLAPGKRADLIVVEGNPLTELGALRRIQHVFTAGRPVARPGK